MSVNQGGRPSKDLSGFKELIEELYLNQQLSAENIRHQLATEYNTVVSTRTLRSAIANWGFYKTTSLEDTPELRIYISTCFYLLGLEDNEIVHVLQDKGRSNFYTSYTRSYIILTDLEFEYRIPNFESQPTEPSP